jgi:MFS family permease
MIASSLIDSVGRRKLVIIGFGGGSAVLTLLSVTAHFIHNSHNDEAVGNTHASKGYYTWIILFLANFYTLFLCMGWLAIDCLTAESFPTKVRSTGRGVCVATGRMAGFCVQFLFGPLVTQNRLSYMMGIAGVFAAGGILVSCHTTDTTNVDLRDHWGNESESCIGQTTTENGALPQLVETKQGHYLSIEQTPNDNMSSRSRKVGQFVRGHV